MISSSPHSSPCFPPHTLAATTHTLKSSGFPHGCARMGEADFLEHTAHFPVVCHPSSISPPNTHSEIHTTEMTPCEVSDGAQTHAHCCIKLKNQKENLPVVIVSPDERLRVNDKQRKRHRGRKSFQRSLLFVVKFEGESVQMQSLHLGL